MANENPDQTYQAVPQKAETGVNFDEFWNKEMGAIKQGIEALLDAMHEPYPREPKQRMDNHITAILKNEKNFCKKVLSRFSEITRHVPDKDIVILFDFDETTGVTHPRKDKSSFTCVRPAFAVICDQFKRINPQIRIGLLSDKPVESLNGQDTTTYPISGELLKHIDPSCIFSSGTAPNQRLNEGSEYQGLPPGVLQPDTGIIRKLNAFETISKDLFPGAHVVLVDNLAAFFLLQDKDSIIYITNSESFSLHN